MLKSLKSKDGTIREYLDWVNEVTENNNRDQLFNKTRVFYRGQSNKDWPIIPSVFRTDEGKYRENDLYTQAKSIAWDVLNGTHTSLEKIIRLQHFGLPTRLLDVTHNPLVALFFACYGDFNRNGCVYWGTNKNIVDTNGFADVIAKEAINQSTITYTCKKIREIFPNYFFNIELWSEVDRNRLIFCLNGLSQPYYILPSYNNSRIKAQKGAFIIPPLICTNGVINPDDNTVYVESPQQSDFRITNYTINGTNKTIFQPQKYIISSKHKKRILSKLNEIGMDMASLFPDNIEALMKHIKDSVRIPVFYD